MSGNQQNLCFSVTIHKLTGYLRFTVYPQQWESYYKIYEGMNTRKIILAGTMSVDEYFDELIDKVQEDYENMRCESVMTHV